MAIDSLSLFVIVALSIVGATLCISMIACIVVHNRCVAGCSVSRSLGSVGSPWVLASPQLCIHHSSSARGHEIGGCWGPAAASLPISSTAAVRLSSPRLLRIPATGATWWRCTLRWLGPGTRTSDCVCTSGLAMRAHGAGAHEPRHGGTGETATTRLPHCCLQPWPTAREPRRWR